MLKRVKKRSRKTRRKLVGAVAHARSALPGSFSRSVVGSLGDLAGFPNLYILGCVPRLRAEKPNNGPPRDDSDTGRFPMLLDGSPERALILDADAGAAYERLLGRLRHVSEQGLPQTLLVTSPCWSDGKSTTAVNLALSLARSGVDTCLVDANLRRPRLSHAFEPLPEPGLARYLEGITLADPFERGTPYAGLSIVTAGETQEDPAQLLGGPRIGTLLQRLAARHRTVIIDAPALNRCDDALTLAPHVEEVCLVTRFRQTRMRDLERAVSTLSDAGVHHLHAILNGQ